MQADRRDDVILLGNENPEWCAFVAFLPPSTMMHLLLCSAQNLPFTLILSSCSSELKMLLFPKGSCSLDDKCKAPWAELHPKYKCALCSEQLHPMHLDVEPATMMTQLFAPKDLAA